MSDKLLRELSGARWTQSKLDKLQIYMSRVTRKLNMSVMPPSAASKKMKIRADVMLDGNQKPLIVGQVMHELTEVGKRLMKELPMSQIAHRSRVETTFSNLTQANEFERRLQKFRDMQETLVSYRMPSDISEATHSIIVGSLKERMSFDPDHIASYINDHKSSSATRGVKWPDLPDPHEDAEWWKEFVEHHRAICDLRLEHPDWFPAFDFNIGGRARPEAQTMKGVTDYDFDSERSRIVMFHPALSTCFAAVPDKKRWYDDVWTQLLTLYGVNEKIWFPPVDGGLCYEKFSSALLNGERYKSIMGDDLNIIKQDGTHVSMDGSNWEQSVGILMGDRCCTALAPFGGTATLPSGVAETSMLGSAALLWVDKKMGERGVDELVGIMEHQPDDAEINFYLGLRFKDDPAFPRLQGLKLSVDRADKTQRLVPSKPTILNSKYSTMQSLSWYNAYHGLTVHGDSLLEPFKKLAASDYMSPSVIIDRLVLDE
jgi:hypothetical protein